MKVSDDKQDGNLPTPKYDPLLAERQKKIFSRFPQTTESDLRRIGVESNSDVVFSLRPTVLQGRAKARMTNSEKDNAQ